jgi:hypothetical protein
MEKTRWRAADRGVRVTQHATVKACGAGGEQDEREP